MALPSRIPHQSPFCVGGFLQVPDPCPTLTYTQTFPHIPASQFPRFFPGLPKGAQFSSLYYSEPISVFTMLALGSL